MTSTRLSSERSRNGCGRSSTTGSPLEKISRRSSSTATWMVVGSTRSWCVSARRALVVGVGFRGSLSPGQDSLVRSILSGGVRPSQRGTRASVAPLLDWHAPAARQQLAASDSSRFPAGSCVYADQRNDGGRCVSARARRLPLVKRYFTSRMRATSPTPIPELALPSRLDHRPVRPPSSTRRASCWRSNDCVPRPLGQPVRRPKRRGPRSPASRPSCAATSRLLALAPSGEVAGFVHDATVYEDDFGMPRASRRRIHRPRRRRRELATSRA